MPASGRGGEIPVPREDAQPSIDRSIDQSVSQSVSQINQSRVAAPAGRDVSSRVADLTAFQSTMDAEETEGERDAVKIMTVDLIRTRQRIIRCYNLYQQLKSISLHTQTLKSAESMADVLQGFIKAVRQLNLHVNQPALQKIMQEFEVHQMRMDMSLEEMEEEDLYEEEEEEEEDVDESEQLVCQVLDELGVDFSILLNHAPQESHPEPIEAQKMVCDEPRIGIGLRDRMNRLRMA
ncbi:hypothetical protein AXG93_291s1220 [Marchantia polymorpha subsp. ruderalis]|uniref:Uncharacterized protein n=1 Tax=Marchantia polymorpha subsp. ruderalis TaxID=1480154 RepID=A0A176VHN5_MARPO|nr:hypothetical protein AXG93_291s1220 [Marchantia polymorpha subsp. ruderalis]